MRIRRCTWSTEGGRRTGVSGISLPLALSDDSSREAASSLSSGEMMRGRADDRLLDVGEQLVRVLDQPRAFLEAAARAVEHQFDLDQACGKIGFGHLVAISLPVALTAPGWAEATLLFVPAARQDLHRRRALVDDARVGVPYWSSGCRAGASLRPAASSMLISPAAARRRAAEQGVDRLLLRLAGGQARRCRRPAARG